MIFEMPKKTSYIQIYIKQYYYIKDYEEHD